MIIVNINKKNNLYKFKAINYGLGNYKPLTFKDKNFKDLSKAMESAKSISDNYAPVTVYFDGDKISFL
tara:strand:+ start:129 stop:332 length:204 start_codon:yes stop_codon:yes gene_type:complete